MSIHVNQKRKQYFICYKATLEDGSQKTITITNANWKTTSVGKKYMQSIEQDEIEKDRKKRKLRIKRKSGDIITLDDLRHDYIIHINNKSKERTAYIKEKHFDHYIYKFFKIGKPIDEVFTIQTINSFINYVSSNKDLKTNSKNKIIAILRECLEFATRMEYMSYELGNKLSTLLIPLANQDEVIEDDQIKVWTKEELDTFMNHFKENDKNKYLYELLYKGGLRLGEALALKWEDLDTVNYRINIYKTLGVKLNITTTKTSSSKSYVYLPKSCVNNLLKLKNELLCANDSDYMFFGKSKPVNPCSIRNQFDKLIEELNLPRITPHGLRHTCATHMLYKGMTIMDVSRHLRHKNVAVTMSTYAHFLPNNMQNQLENIFD